MAKVKSPKQVTLENIVRLAEQQSALTAEILNKPILYENAKYNFLIQNRELTRKMKEQLDILQKIFSEQEKIIPIGFDFK